ncbi:MAG: DUF89 family protein [Tenericutes bacterium]|nr:DUF89 family protein [Mycoplasmatota bacterium]
MKTSLMCMECNIKQVIKLSELLNISKDLQEVAIKKMFKELSEISFEMSNPEIMGSITWRIITEVFGNENPYKEIKKFYNQSLLDVYEKVEKIIIDSDNMFDTALKIAVIGNVIDFAARHKFDKNSVFEMMEKVDEISFVIDSREALISQLEQCKQLLYIGDNCGEIVLDKLFIKTIKRIYPNIKIYFGVRGKAIINDVTIEDALQVGMEEVAEVISSGAMFPGTILHKSSDEFQKVFKESSVVLAKGQGNFESLSDVKRKGLFLMLLVKCSYIAENIPCKEMDYIIKENL